MTLGGFLVALAMATPVLGPPIIPLVHGKTITSPSALAVLSSTLIATALIVFLLGVLFVSSSVLLRKANTPAPLRTAETPPIRTVNPLVLVLPCTLALVFFARTYFLAGQSLTYDEVSEVVADVETPLLTGLNPRAFLNHISGSLLARLGSLLGPTERAFRLPSVLLSTIGLCAAAIWLYKRTSSALGTTLFLLLLATHPLIASQSYQIRGYPALYWAGLLTLLGVSDTLNAERWAICKRPLPIAAITTVAAILLGLSHLFGLAWLLFVTIALHTICWRRSSAAFARSPAPPTQADPLAAATLSAGLGFASMVAILGWARAFPWLFYLQEPRSAKVEMLALREFVVLFAGRPEAYLQAGASSLLLLGSAAILYVRRPTFRFLVIAAAAPLLTSLAAAAYFRPTFFYARFIGLALVVLALTAGLCVATIERHVGGVLARFALGAGLVTLLLSLTIPGTASLYRGSTGNREAAAAILAWRNEALGRGGRLFLFGGWQAEVVAGYYLKPVVSSTPPNNVWTRRRRQHMPDCLVSLSTGVDTAGDWIPGALHEATERKQFVVDGQTPLECWCFESVGSGPLLGTPAGTHGAESY